MKKLLIPTSAALLGLGLAGVMWQGAMSPAQAQEAFAGGGSERLAAQRSPGRGRDQNLDRDYYPDLKKKLVPIITVGSSVNIGVAQVQGEERDVDRCKAVAQIETDYKDVARIKILVPVQSEGIIKNIDRVPGVSVSAVADYAVKR